MSDYRSPGVHVEEVFSAVKPIAGVGTSTAGFIGAIPDTITIPEGVPTQTIDTIKGELIGTSDGTKKIFALKNFPVIEKSWTFTIKVDDSPVSATLKNETSTPPVSLVFFKAPPSSGEKITAAYISIVNKVPTLYTEEIGTGDGKTDKFALQHIPAIDLGVNIKGGDPATDVTIQTITPPPVSLAVLNTAPTSGQTVTADYQVPKTVPGGTTTFNPHPAGEPVLCTNFTQFKDKFGDFSTDKDQNRLAHAVYGFFNNGGTRCWVTRVAKKDVMAFKAALESFEAIDEIALVAIPGETDKTVQEAILSHCENMKDRFAILDGRDADTPQKDNITATRNSDYGAIYYPWIQAFDPATKGNIYVPPSGHIAGVYARVDTERGVHKAPANAVIRGALGVKKLLSKAEQDGLNPDGINVIRQFNGNTTVWGARTFAGKEKADLKYINVRRTLLFLRESIEQGTQWVVFEPNEPGLWAKITRNVTAFLTNVWRSGALFGTTAQEAFYVKCDAETNLPVRDQGQVVTEIGVSIVRPAEFVIFRISQFTAPAK